MSSAINMLKATARNGERYIFTWHDRDRDRLAAAVADCAMDPELDFSWIDAGYLLAHVATHLPETAEQPGA